MNLVRNLCEWKTYDREKGTSNRQPIERLLTAVSRRHGSSDIRLRYSCACSNRWLPLRPHSFSRSQRQAPRICGARPVIDCDRREVQRGLLNPAGVMSAHSRAFFQGAISRLEVCEARILRPVYTARGGREDICGIGAIGCRSADSAHRHRSWTPDAPWPELCDSLPVAMVVRAGRRMLC